MKKLFSYLFICVNLIIVNVNSQEIDSSIINNLSGDQLKAAQEILESDKFFLDSSNEKTIITDSTKKDDDDDEIFKSNSINKFGYNFINTSPTTISATADLPLPNEYRISLNDTLKIILSGSMQEIFELDVLLDGTIFFPELGSISVAGETLGQIKTKLNSLIEQAYIGVNINISLTNLSAKKIIIVGAVNNPGIYTVNPFTTISNALSYSGGIKDYGSLRDIKLIRSNGEVFNFDLYSLLIFGERSYDITIESGDVILIGAARKFVQINGAIVRPMTYEMLPGEDLTDLINFSLGLLSNANTSDIVLTKFDLPNSKVNKTITDDINSNLSDVVSVDIFSIGTKLNSEIFVAGAVKEPGFYKLEENTTLEKLINNIDFIDVYPWLAVLEQFDDKNLIKSIKLFNINDKTTYENVKIFGNSRVYFATLSSYRFEVSGQAQNLIDEFSLTINHKNKTYKFPVYGEFTVREFINLAGLDMSNVDQIATYISPLDDRVIQDDLINMKLIAKKFHNISFRSPTNDLIRVSVSGAVEYPGAYTLQPDSTLADLYKLIGEFDKEAYLEGIVFTRQSVRERQLKSIQKSQDDLNRAILVKTQQGENLGDLNILRFLSESIEPENLGRIAGDFSPSSRASIKTILFQGDSIFVPRNPNTVTVLGEVLNPISFEYENRMSIKDVILNAGGYQQYADKSRVYVIKANGLVEKAKRNVFLGNTQLGPGDTVVVPRKIYSSNPGIAALIPLTTVLSDLAFSAAALESLTNNN